LLLNISNIEIPYNPDGYMVVCVNFNKDKNLYNKFELDIHSEYKLESVKANNFFKLKKKTFEIYGKWDAFNSGGGVSDITFFKNPQYELIISKSTDSYIELKTQHGYQVALLIIDLEGSFDIITLLNKNFSSTEYSEELFYYRYRLEAGKKYIMIPFTNIPKQVRFC
jgi:hypothetical protein